MLIVVLPYTSFHESLLKQSGGKKGITGRANFGTIGLVILGPDLNIFIDRPENITYNFSIGDNYIIDLNVSADSAVDKWWYTLVDLRHNTIVNNSIVFTPNTTISAVRWSNRLTVFANDSSGLEANASVVFYVSVPNSAPIIKDLSSEILVCEGDALSYPFNATDADEDDLTTDITPRDPFFVTPASRINLTDVTATIISGTLTKNDVGIYQETVSVSDSQYVDTGDTNITVIEINNVPSVSNVGVQTVWTQGDNSSFYKEVQVSDVENGNQTSGNFTFNLTFLSGNKFFNITQLGIMNFTANTSLIGVYNLSLCITDLALASIHPNISFCGQDGLNQTVCQNFSLTVTNENRAPTITANYPSNLTLSVSGTDSLFFNITEYDPDGTIPDAYWYVDGSFVEYDSGSSYDEFNYSFGCGVGGGHTIRAEITDGLLNDSIEWSLSVSRVQCPVPPEGGGGGGGGIARPYCTSEWVCDKWQVCQNAKESLNVGIFSGDDYRYVQEWCSDGGLDDSFCGVQIRKCFDLNNCGTMFNKPSEVEGCYFVREPGCFDGVKNCHDGGCELLVDCGGGICNPCPTCSDGIKNQGEGGIDCGGPCPWKCPAEVPAQINKYYLFALLLILIISILLATIKIIKIIRLRKKLHQISKKTS